jgi:hypothetical protein
VLQALLHLRIARLPPLLDLVSSTFLCGVSSIAEFSGFFSPLPLLLLLLLICMSETQEGLGKESGDEESAGEEGEQVRTSWKDVQESV